MRQQENKKGNGLKDEKAESVHERNREAGRNESTIRSIEHNVRVKSLQTFQN